MRGRPVPRDKQQTAPASIQDATPGRPTLQHFIPDSIAMFRLFIFPFLTPTTFPSFPYLAAGKWSATAAAAAPAVSPICDAFFLAVWFAILWVAGGLNQAEVVAKGRWASFRVICSARTSVFGLLASGIIKTEIRLVKPVGGCVRLC